MVSDVVISALVGGVTGSTITAITQLYATMKQQRAETERRQAEFYLELKVGALTDLHSALDSCYRTIDDHYKKNEESVGRENYLEEVVPSLEEYERTLSQVAIYLDDNEKEKLESALRELRRGVMSLQDKAISVEYEPREIDWESLDSAYDSAKDILRNQMNEPIKQLES